MQDIPVASLLVAARRGLYKLRLADAGPSRGSAGLFRDGRAFRLAGLGLARLVCHHRRPCLVRRRVPPSPFPFLFSILFLMYIHTALGTLHQLRTWRFASACISSLSSRHSFQPRLCTCIWNCSCHHPALIWRRIIHSGTHSLIASLRSHASPHLITRAAGSLRCGAKQLLHLVQHVLGAAVHPRKLSFRCRQLRQLLQYRHDLHLQDGRRSLCAAHSVRTIQLRRLDERTFRSVSMICAQPLWRHQLIDCAAAFASYLSDTCSRYNISLPATTTSPAIAQFTGAANKSGLSGKWTATGAGIAMFAVFLTMLAK